MPGIHKLSQKQIERAEKQLDISVENGTAKDSRMSDGGGLSLHLRKRGAMYWSVQVTVKAAVGFGKRIEIGLGRYPVVDLKTARKKAAEVRDLADEGVDIREQRKSRIRENQRKSKTFEQVCGETFDALKAKLKGNGKNGRWMSPLAIHVIPKIGNTPIEDLDQHDIVKVLQPIWHSKAVTAGKCMDRIGLVLKHASAADLDVSLETTAKARVLLGTQKHTVKNIPAMPWQDVPDFYDALAEDNTVQLALKLLILTGARSGSVRQAQAEQFKDDVWLIPAENTKTGLEFEIPLSKEAQRIVDIARTRSKSSYLFTSPRKGVISDMAMGKFMKDRNLDYRPHGFRSSLRDWLTEETNAQWDTREKILAHKVGDSTSQAYDRSKDLKRRGALMERWAGYVSRTDAVVINLPKAS